MKIRKIKQNLWARRFVSNGHYPDIEPRTEKEWRDAVMSKFMPTIHGPTHDDARSQQRRRKVPHGRRALRTLPYDIDHQDRRSWKKLDHKTRMADRAQARAWKQHLRNKSVVSALTEMANRTHEANKHLFEPTPPKRSALFADSGKEPYVPFGHRVRPEFE